MCLGMFMAVLDIQIVVTSLHEIQRALDLLFGEGEFARRQVSREALMAQWQVGWSALFAAIDPLTDADLTRTITIRRQPMTVHEALHRSLAHISYHVGQIVYLAKAMKGGAWTYLSIPPRPTGR